MSASFSSVDSAEQQRLLDSHWDRLRSPELVPALREMAAPWPEERGSKQMEAAYRGSPQATALFRWYEVDPQGAYEEILRQIGSAQPTLYADAIDFLPAKSLPQFEEIWTKSLMQAATEDRQGVLLSLMARFGTGASVPAVREALNGKIGVWDCREQSAALAYLVRFDEAGASGVIEAAVAARGEDKTGCNHTVFTDVGHYVSNKGLIAEAVKALNDPAVDVKLDALNYLAGYGDRTAEQPLLVRYLARSDRWRGHEDHLESRAGDLGSSEEKSLGKALLKAVMANQGWVPSGGEVASAASRCVGKDLCADAAEMMRKSTDAPVIVSFWDLGQEPQLTVAQFTPVSFDLLKQKIEQFPKGTLFEVYQFAETKIKNQALYGRIMKMLVDAGMKAD